MTFTEFTGLLESESFHKEVCLWLWESAVPSRSWFSLLSSASNPPFDYLWKVEAIFQMSKV